MFVRLLLLFSIIPLVELALLIKLGGIMGVIPTVLLVAGTGVGGAYLAKSQGFKLLQEVLGALKEGQIPADHLIEGMLMLVGAVLLVTPGVLTDLSGIVLFIPYTRRVVARFTRKKFTQWLREGKFNISYSEVGTRAEELASSGENGAVDV